uniref:Uncharacterized protein n=1 Tax=Candidatus Kentrum sp. FW TaxID=2126338 RepID=A0A450SIL0_9GAMM|nr:MAG: hypothetical protein BECKFW1821B_GA0114236_101411 [Candidatus Kentron sp. FW]VFJ55666.1 MAG: hypothetical protein BECKFW1821A_GA0114235_10556 [Candidatus Kentron sp. FW]
MVEDNEIPFIGTYPIHVIGGLLEAVGQGRLQRFVQNFEIDDRSLNRASDVVMSHPVSICFFLLALAVLRKGILLIQMVTLLVISIG